jgi:hypothetical protein
MIQARIKQLNKTIHNRLIDNKQYNMCVSTIYKEAGDSFLLTDKTTARKYYIMSIKHNIFELFSYINFIKTVM